MNKEIEVGNFVLYMNSYDPSRVPQNMPNICFKVDEVIDVTEKFIVVKENSKKIEKERVRSFYKKEEKIDKYYLYDQIKSIDNLEKGIWL